MILQFRILFWSFQQHIMVFIWEWSLQICQGVVFVNINIIHLEQRQWLRSSSHLWLPSDDTSTPLTKKDHDIQLKALEKDK